MVSEEQNKEFMMSVENEEVKQAVFTMYPEKYPGVDGLNPAFFPYILGHCGEGCGWILLEFCCNRRVSQRIKPYYYLFNLKG